MDDSSSERQRRLQREMSDRFERSYALRLERDRISKRMQDLEEDFQVCQNRLRDVEEQITNNETVCMPSIEYARIAYHCTGRTRRRQSSASFLRSPAHTKASGSVTAGCKEISTSAQPPQQPSRRSSRFSTWTFFLHWPPATDDRAERPCPASQGENISLRGLPHHREAG